MKPTELNVRCFQCGSRRMRIHEGRGRPDEDRVYCQNCTTYLGRRSDIAHERRRLITGAANDDFEAAPNTLTPDGTQQLIVQNPAELSRDPSLRATRPE